MRISKSRTYGTIASIIFAMSASAFLAPAMAHADSDTTDTSEATAPTKKTSKSKVSDAQNNRMQALAGSASKWSGQFNLYYTGPAVTSPFGVNAPNPMNSVPPPMVNLSGTVSVRYRLGPGTALSFGSGLMVYTPFNSPKGWSLSDPYVNYSRLVKTGPIHSYLEAGATFWTNNQYYNQLGYRYGFTFNDQSYYVFKGGLTVGMNLWAGVNTFDGSKTYDPTNQDAWYLGGGPYVEYSLSQKVNLRTVLGVTGDHVVATPGNGIVWENPYQSLGVGVQIMKPWYLYAYVEASPYSGNFTASNTGLGFNTIINLF